MAGRLGLFKKPNCFSLTFSFLYEMKSNDISHKDVRCEKSISLDESVNFLLNGYIFIILECTASTYIFHMCGD